MDLVAQKVFHKKSFVKQTAVIIMEIEMALRLLLVDSSQALANNPCLSCSFECFCIEEKRYPINNLQKGFKLTSALKFANGGTV
jgi:hypothetical protein